MYNNYLLIIKYMFKNFYNNNLDLFMIYFFF